MGHVPVHQTVALPDGPWYFVLLASPGWFISAWYRLWVDRYWTFCGQKMLAEVRSFAGIRPSPSFGFGGKIEARTNGFRISVNKKPRTAIHQKRTPLQLCWWISNKNMYRSLGRGCFVEEVLRQKAKELNKKGFSIVSANDVRALDVFHGALNHGISWPLVGGKETPKMFGKKTQDTLW